MTADSVHVIAEIISTAWYTSAAVCRRGHLFAADTSLVREFPSRCVECGARVLGACPECGHRIRGHYTFKGDWGGHGDWERPRFCDECGTPFPWLDRQGLIYELENLLAEEQVDKADALAVREQLEVLAQPDLDEAEQRKRWEKVKRLAPGLWEKGGGRAILESVVSASIKAGLGL